MDAFEFLEGERYYACLTPSLLFHIKVTGVLKLGIRQRIFEASKRSNYKWDLALRDICCKKDMFFCPGMNMLLHLPKNLLCKENTTSCSLKTEKEKMDIGFSCKKVI